MSTSDGYSQDELTEMYEDPKKAMGDIVNEVMMEKILKDYDPQALQNYLQGAKMKKQTTGTGQNLTASQIATQQTQAANTAAAYFGGSTTATQAASAWQPWGGPLTTSGSVGPQPYAPYTTSGSSIPFNPPYATEEEFGYTPNAIENVRGAVINITEDLKEWSSIGFIGSLMRYVWWKDKHSGGKHLLSLAFFDTIILRLVTVADSHNGKLFKDCNKGELIEMVEDNTNLVLERKFKNRHDVLKYFFTRELGEDAGIWKIAENL